MTNKDAELSKSDLALIDALTVLTDLLIDQGVLKEAALKAAVQSRYETWVQKGKPQTASILELWRQLATDPEFRAHRIADRALLAKPEGTA